MDFIPHEPSYEVVLSPTSNRMKDKLAGQNKMKYKDFLKDDDNNTASTAISSRSGKNSGVANYASFSEADEIESAHLDKSFSDVYSQSEEGLTLITSIFQDTDEPPMHDFAVNLNNASMTDKSELTMDTAKVPPNHFQKMELLDVLRKAVQSQMNKVENRRKTKEHFPDASMDKKNNKMHIQIDVHGTYDTANMTTISEDDSHKPVGVTNILTSKSSNVSMKYKSDTSVLTAKTFFSDDSTVKENFRFERLHSYGRKQQVLRREIDAIHKVDMMKREYIFNLRLKEKKKKIRKKSSLPPPEKRGQRIHDTYSSRKNEEGRKRREAIQRKNELAAERRSLDMRLRL